jgi:nicotinate-nucleotide pyrophosphorylase (carboxylating)
MTAVPTTEPTTELTLASTTAPMGGHHLHAGHPLSERTIRALAAAHLGAFDVLRVLEVALEEDLHTGFDVTSVATISPSSVSAADVVIRKDGVFGGAPLITAALEWFIGDRAQCKVHVGDGDRVKKGDVVATIQAPTIELLTIERTMLNLICRVSGTATLTRAWVDAVSGTNAKIRDTRKTTPGMRAFEKYAVRCGGGINHRIGLYDAVLIKDNHVLAAGGVGAALDLVRAAYADRPDLVIQTEIDHLDQLDEAIDHGAQQILLDNMSPALMSEAVARCRAKAPEVLLEASGGLTLDTAAAVAASGVDFISVGGLTHSAPILDIALDFKR